MNLVAVSVGGLLVDITNKAEPWVVSSYQHGSYLYAANAGAVDGNYLYVACYAGNIFTVVAASVTRLAIKITIYQQPTKFGQEQVSPIGFSDLYLVHLRPLVNTDTKHNMQPTVITFLGPKSRTRSWVHVYIYIYYIFFVNTGFAHI